MVTVAIYGWESENERNACIEHVRKQTLADIEILTQGEDEDSISFRNRAIAEAKGEHIAFLQAGMRYSFFNALHMLLLFAVAENAKMVVGKCCTKDGQKSLYPDNLPWDKECFILAERYNPMGGLAACLFDCEFLRLNKLFFETLAVASDLCFLRKVSALAGKIFAVCRTFVQGTVSKGGLFSKADLFEGELSHVLSLLRFAEDHDLPWVRKAALDGLFQPERAASFREFFWALPCGMVKDRFKGIFVQISKYVDGKMAEEAFLNPLVSVIVPAYKVGKYLARCLDSLVGQSLRSIEIIVVDDGSPDDVPEICDDYAVRYSTVRVVHRVNGGRSAARNSGMEVARGKYIGFVDGDDFVDGDMFAEMSRILENDLMADLASCEAKVEYSYEVSDEEKKYAQQWFVQSCAGGQDLTPTLVGAINSSVCTKLYRRSFLIRNGIRFPEGMNNEDEVFYFFTFARARRAQLIKRQYYHYIRNANGIMAQQLADNTEKQSLPDGLTKTMPLILEFLLRDDRRDLLGIFFHKLCGLSNRFQTENAYRAIAHLLEISGFKFRQDFLDVKDLGWVRNRLSKIANYPAASEGFLPVDTRMFPCPCQSSGGGCESPLLSFIVPVFNAELNVEFCLESLRKQTLRDIDIILVDDGSSDESVNRILPYVKADRRVRLVQQPNVGVSEARNRGLREAKGKYIAFADADDWLSPTAAEEAVLKCEKLKLDICWYDYQCFHYDTRKPIAHYWTFANHPEMPTGVVFEPQALASMSFNTGIWQMVVRKDFLDQCQAKFPSCPLAEDALFLYELLPQARRAFIISKPYYHYRRGNPSSAISRLTAGCSGDVAKVAQSMYINRLATLARRLQREMPRPAFLVLLRRFYSDLLFYAEKSKDFARQLLCDHADAFEVQQMTADILGAGTFARLKKIKEIDLSNIATEERLPVIQPATPKPVAQKMQAIMAARETVVHDLYVVTGQLNSVANDPLDSWTFFTWLQNRGVPSKYVVWEKHPLYERERNGKHAADIVALSGDGVSDYEFVEKCEDYLIRAKAIVQENVALHPLVWRWLARLPGCERVFLQHGVMYWKMAESLSNSFACVNIVNVSSKREQAFLEQYVPVHPDVGQPVRYVIAGLPRWDLLEDRRKARRREYVVFVMFTWRSSFGDSSERLGESAYFRQIVNFMSRANVARLKRAKVRIVFALHHHLANHILGMKWDIPVDFVKQGDIAYWISHADCCVTDYSSVSFDFMFLNKPTVYWIPDVNDLTLNANDQAEIRFAKARQKEMYNGVATAEEAMSMLEYYAKRHFVLEPEKVKMATEHFECRKNVCQRLYEALETSV